MVTTLDRSSIDEFVARPGITLVNWYGRRHPLSRLFDEDYQNASTGHPEVNFADVDITADPALAASWGVSRGPELMGFRDGTLVFNHAGALPEQIIEALIDAIASLDMERIRQEVDGGSRLYLSMRPKGAARFHLGGSGDGGPASAAGGRPSKH
jgi:thioredoxin reductase (NADPH)